VVKLDEEGKKEGRVGYEKRMKAAGRTIHRPR